MKYRIICYGNIIYVVQYKIDIFTPWHSFTAEHESLEQAERSMNRWLDEDREKLNKKNLKKSFKIIKVEKV